MRASAVKVFLATTRRAPPPKTTCGIVSSVTFPSPHASEKCLVVHPRFGRKGLPGHDEARAAAEDDLRHRFECDLPFPPREKRVDPFEEGVVRGGSGGRGG